MTRLVVTQTRRGQATVTLCDRTFADYGDYLAVHNYWLNSLLVAHKARPDGVTGRPDGYTARYYSRSADFTITVTES